MYTNKELQNKVIDSVNTILCLNPKEAIRMLRGGKVVDFTLFKK